jgi:4-coumarate--CoA ligase
MIYRGIKVVVVPSFTPEVFLQVLQDHKVTGAFLVPPILIFISKHPMVDNYNLTNLRWIVSAAAPLSKNLVRDVHKRLKIPVKQAYGMTETSPATHAQLNNDWHSSIGSVGKLLPNLEAKYVSEDGTVLPKGSVGEIWVKGPNVFPGYLNNPAATAKSLTSDGYYKTGDIGYEDAEGNFFITDRLKELIKYKGFQVPPAELEGVLVGYEKVADACVVGIYDESQATELPLAFVVKAPAVADVDDKTLAADILAFCNGQVANHKKLRGGVRFVDSIPKSAAGKILRRVLRDQISAEVEQKKAKAKL